MMNKGDPKVKRQQLFEEIKRNFNVWPETQLRMNQALGTAMTEFLQDMRDNRSNADNK